MEDLNGDMSTGNGCQKNEQCAMRVCGGWGEFNMTVVGDLLVVELRRPERQIKTLGLLAVYNTSGVLNRQVAQRRHAPQRRG